MRHGPKVVSRCCLHALLAAALIPAAAGGAFEAAPDRLPSTAQSPDRSAPGWPPDTSEASPREGEWAPPPPKGVERLVTPDRRIAWYLPAGIEEDPPPLLVYPYLGLGSDGEAWLCLKLSRGSWFRWLHPEEARFSFGGRDLTIGFDSSEVWFRFAPEGAREEVTFTNRVDLIRAIADAPDVVVVLAGPDGREERHGFDPGDRERFRSILSLFDDLRGSGARFHPGGWTIEESIPWPLPASLPKLVPESRVNPRWPDSGRSWRRQGTVVLSAYVLPDGTVGGLRSLKEAGRNHEFAEAAIEAVRRWRYEPATANGRPVPASLSVTVEFRHQEQ